MIKTAHAIRRKGAKPVGADAMADEARAGRPGLARLRPVAAQQFPETR